MSLTKKLFGSICILACAASMQVSAEPIEIKFSHVVAENTPKGKWHLSLKP